MKRIGILLLSVLLLLALLPGVDLPAAADEADICTYLLTSYDVDNYMEFSIAADTVTVSGKLQLDDLEGLMVRCGENREFIETASGRPFTVELPLTHGDLAPLDVYTRISTKESYWSVVWNRVYVQKTDRGYCFPESPVLKQNLAMERAYLDPARYMDDSGVPEAVRDLSDKIVGLEQTDYGKLFLLHKWAAENLYYDYDAYYNGTDTCLAPEEILESRRSICAGYSSFLKDLILAQGIPCMESTTYALGVSTNGGSFVVKPEFTVSAASNHEHVEAWADGRWIIMDATWDSRNKYLDGEYLQDAPNGYYYFDIAPELFAYDHMYITRGDLRLTLQDGYVTGADEPPLYDALPTGHRILLNGTEREFNAYVINDNNYFKLRDLAAALSGTEKQFEVTWDGQRRAIGLLSGRGYTPVGGERAPKGDARRSALSSTAMVFLDGKYTPLKAYNIDDNNYYMLRDLAAALDFSVVWDEETRTVVIDTSAGYVPE